jgi:hypothetical protein
MIKKHQLEIPLMFINNLIDKMKEAKDDNALLALYVETFYHIFNTNEVIYREHFINQGGLQLIVSQFDCNDDKLTVQCCDLLQLLLSFKNEFVLPYPKVKQILHQQFPQILALLFDPER